jgi:hypothetical protein
MAWIRLLAKSGVIGAALCACTTALADGTRCEPLTDGVEYRAFLADQNRYVYVDVKVQQGVVPSIFVIADKNYLSANGPATNTWWLDRTRPMLFSNDKVKVSWEPESRIYAVGSWFGDAEPSEIVQPIRGLTKGPSGFSGTGSHDTNSFAFQTRLEMPDFGGDAFDVTLPAITLDGATVTPPVVHVLRDGQAITTKC